MKTIGSVEDIIFSEINDNQLVKARIDTGAKTSAISALAELQNDKKLHVTFLHLTKPHTVLFDSYRTAIVASSNGHVESRYKVKLQVRIDGRKIRAYFTLTDRSSQVYPVLIGRNILEKRFVVDVSKGTPDIEAEKERTQQLEKELSL